MEGVRWEPSRIPQLAVAAAARPSAASPSSKALALQQELLELTRALEAVDVKKRELLAASASAPMIRPLSPLAPLGKQQSTQNSPARPGTEILMDVTLCVCGDEIPSSGVKAHQRDICPLREVRCSHPGCGAVFPENHRAEHEAKTCAFARRTRKLLQDRDEGDTLVTCEICNDASLHIRKRHLKRHELYMCEKRTVSCRFAEWGCDSKFPFDQQERHEASECAVAVRRRKIAADAEFVNEETECEWCGQTVKKRHLLDHQEEECPERERPCPNEINGCKEWVPVGKVNEHLRSECKVTLERNELAARAREKNTPIICEECGAAVKLRHLDRHRQSDCISRIVPCKNAAHGCKARLRWRDRHLHEDFMALSGDRSMLHFKTGGDSYILLNRDQDVLGSADISPPWTAEYYVWIVDPQEEILSLLHLSLEQVEQMAMNQRENQRWQEVSTRCKKKLKELKNARKHKGVSTSTRKGEAGSAAPSSVSMSAKELADEFNEADNEIIRTQKGVLLAKGWIQLNMTEANRIFETDIQDESKKQAVREAVAAQAAEILTSKPLIQEMLPEQEVSMLSNLEAWARHIATSGNQTSGSASDRKQKAKEQQKLLSKRSELTSALEGLDPGDSNTDRLRRRYNRELEKVNAKLALTSENTPVEILERRGRHIIASSAKNAISLVSGPKGELTFFRSATGKAAREVNFQVQLERNKWYHVALAASKKEVSLFLNGALKSIKRGVFDLPFTRLGASQRGDSFQGFIQEIRYWRECRSLQQIQQTAATILNVAKSKTLAAYWTFEEAMGDLVDDMSLQLPRAPCFNTGWVIFNTPAIRKRFGIPLTPSYRDQTSCFINQRLKLLAQRARDREMDNVECRQGCGGTINVRRLETHHRLECVHRMVVCQEIGCGQVHLFSDRQQHLTATCERYRYREELVQRYHEKEELVECDLLCGETIKKRAITHHYHHECRNRLITCPRADCQETIVAKTLQRHIDSECKSPSLILERKRIANARLRLALKTASIHTGERRPESTS